MKKVTVKLWLKDLTAVIESCQNIIISLYVIIRFNFCTNCTVILNEYTVISSQAQITILITSFDEVELLNDRDLLFESDNISIELTVYAHIVNHARSEVLIYNESEHSMILLQKTHLEQVVEYKADSCYSAHLNISLLAIRESHSRDNESWICRSFWSILISVAAFNVVTNDVFTVNSLSLSELSTETLLMNEITVYSGTSTLYQITEVISQYPQLWEDWGNIVNVSESEWMNISLFDNWRELYKAEQVKVYSLRKQNKELVDKTFNKLHTENCLKWVSTITSFTYLCFVVWRDTQEGCKNRVVVNIWALNKITISDIYSVPFQVEILAAVHSSNYISTIDCSSFFHQWRVKSEACHKLTVSSHWGQEVFKVTVMKYRNSSVYVQRIIDKILWEQQQFAWVYMNNIVISFNTLNEHLQHLNSVFKVLAKKNICLSSKKSFLRHFSVKLLDQKVNTLNLITAAEKLEVITWLKFSKSLSALEKYLDLTEYLQQYISRYAVISKPLQEQKMLLNKVMRKWSSKSVKGTVRKKAVQRVKVEMSTSWELQIFDQL